MTRLLTNLGALTFTLAGPMAQAATYYVAQKVNGADDANPGTPRRPWKTLARATRDLQPGDTLVIHGGVYREKITLPRSGKPSAPITLRAADGERPVISGADEVRLWRPAGGAAPVYQTPWEHVFAIDIRDGKPVRAHGEEAPVGRAEQAFWWGRPLRMVLRREQLAPETFTIDDEKKQLYAWLPGDPTRGGAELSTRDVLLEPAGPNGASHIYLRGLTFRYAANFAQRGAVRITGNHWRVEDCVFERANGPGASIIGSDHLLRRCTFRDNGQLGFGAYRAHRLRLEACRLLRNNVKGFSSGWEAGGCKIVLTRGAVLDRCVARGNAGPGFWFDIGNEDCLVRSCYARENEVGLMYEISYRLTARNNLMVENGDPRGPAWGTGGIMISSSPGCVLQNNVCVGNRAGIAYREQTRTTPRIDDTRGSPEVPISCANEVVRNNILAYNWEHQLAFWFDTRFFGPHPSGGDRDAPSGRDPAQEGYTLADNLFFAAPAQALILYGARWRSKSTLHASLATFSKASGIPATGLVAEPRFLDSLSGDYRLAPDSPARRLKAGLTNPSVIPRGDG